MSKAIDAWIKVKKTENPTPAQEQDAFDNISVEELLHVASLNVGAMDLSTISEMAQEGKDVDPYIDEIRHQRLLAYAAIEAIKRKMRP